MTIEAMLSGLSTAEKLDAMDFLWRDLTTPFDLASMVSRFGNQR